MNIEKLIERSWVELVFDNRNKAYGAYDLRKHYSDRVIIGMFVTLSTIALVFVIPYLTDRPSVVPDITQQERGRVIFIDPPPLNLPKQKQVVAPAPRRKADPRDVRIVTEPVETQPVEIQDLTVTSISEGETPGAYTGPVEGLVEEPITPIVDNGPVSVAEVMPAYDGGIEGMMRFIKRKLRYPSLPRKLGIDGTVYVQFVVRGDGTVTDVQTIRGVHADLDAEAERVISLMDGWKGGKQGGYPVAVRMVLPIKFMLQ